MNSINVEEIVSKTQKFNSDRDWSQFHSIKNLSMALSVECSELVEIFQWMKEEESNQISSNQNLKSKVEEEVADIFLYLMQITAKAEIDLEAAVFRKMALNEEKYPIEKARGLAVKYSNFKK